MTSPAAPDAASTSLVDPTPPERTPRGLLSRLATPSDSATRVSRLGRIFIAIATLEAVTWAGLLVGMFLKYVTETTDHVVTVFGTAHGGAFLVYGALSIVCAIAFRWRWWVTLLALAAAVPPLVTVPLELWMRRRRLLHREPAAASTTVGTPA
ncbi:DUF3817 domain-containing protein [Schumannella soli]|uniref:DUF3817 domain-containing protein n=1 Tax=Schumannella soli TaxID=2590779 RepID=UPI0021047CAB|nr:DUF3817 domain-containing protein [Schumannella soli]